MQLTGYSLAAGTYGPASGNVLSASATLTQGSQSSPSWNQSFQGPGGKPDQGTFFLTITAPGAEQASGPNIDNGMDKEWDSPHGTFAATLPATAGGGAMGTVTVVATF